MGPQLFKSGQLQFPLLQLVHGICQLFDEAGGPGLVATGQDLQLLLCLGGPLGFSVESD